MLTLYTAIGQLTTKPEGCRFPLVLMNQQEYALTPQELILWSSLAFQILTKPELKERYDFQIQKQEITDRPDFEHFLRRLLLRGIVAEGSGYTGIDALYRLLGTLYPVPVKNTPAMRLYECFYKIATGKMKLSRIKMELQEPELKKMDALILRLSDTFHFSVAELLGYVELAVQPVPPTEDVYQLYHNPDETCDSLADKMQLNHTQFPILQSIGNLYLHKKILFTKY